MKRTVAIATLALLLWAAPAAAQGCAMCARGATAAGERAQHSLQRGVLVLLLPPVGMMVGLLVVAFRYRGPRQQP